MSSKIGAGAGITAVSFLPALRAPLGQRRRHRDLDLGDGAYGGLTLNGSVIKPAHRMERKLLR